MSIALGPTPKLARAAAWLRDSRAGLFPIAIVVGVGSGLGAVVFRYLIYGFTWLATGQDQFGQGGYVGSDHFKWLGLGFLVLVPVVGGLIYGPMIYRYAREARGHGVPEVMIAVAENGGRIRPQVERGEGRGLRRLHRRGGFGRPGGSDRADRLGARLVAGAVDPHAGEPDAHPGRLRCGRRHRRDLQRPHHRRLLRGRDHPARVLHRRAVHRHALGDDRGRRRDPVPGQRAVPVEVPVRHRARAHRRLRAGRGARGAGRPARPGLPEDRVRHRGPVGPDVAQPPRVGPPGDRRHRARPDPAGPAADVRRRLSGHGQVDRRQLCAVVPADPRRRQDHRLQHHPRHRRLRRRLRAVAVRRRHRRDGVRRGRPPHLRGRRRRAGPLRRGRHGRGVHRRRPGSADLGRQRRGTHRRLRPHPAGHARGRHRHRDVPGGDLRDDLHHQVAAPRAGHRPLRALARVRRPQGR